MTQPDPYAAEQYAPDLDPEELAFQRRFGPWRAWSLDDVDREFAGFSAPWWIVGGHAIEAYTGVPRGHDDVDVAIFLDDLPRLREHFAGRFHLWSVGSRTLRPLDDDNPGLHDHSNQVWLREHALAPWCLDVSVSDRREGQWVFRRDPTVTMPLDRVTWTDDRGRRIMRPEIVLAYKAELLRPKDDADFAATWPRLGAEARGWLRETIGRLYPDHPWANPMAAPDRAVRRAGERVRLREATLADAAVVDAWNADPDFAGEYGDFGGPLHGPLAKQLAHGQRQLGAYRGALLVERIADGVLIGDVSWHPERYGPNAESTAVNFGITLAPEFRGQGLGVEAQRLLAELLFELYPDLARVEASTDVTNHPEQRALEKAGLTREGVLRRAQYRRGAHHDLVLYSLVRDELSLSGHA